jgi:3-oxoacyl-[acyl-carrier-protein] synthase II
VELAASILALKHGVVPFTLNYENPDPLCRLNVIRREPLAVKNLTALSVNRTAMGQSAAAVIRAL